MTTILKGDTSQAITIALSDGFDYSGKTVVVEYQGVCRSFSNAAAGGSITFSFSAAETSPMTLGAFPLRVSIHDADGFSMTLKNADVKIRVTDCPADLTSDEVLAVVINGALHGMEGLGERWTDADAKSKINEIIRRLGGVAALLVLCALPAFGASITVQTTRKDLIYNDGQVVTNVQLDTSGLLTEHQDISGKADKADTYTKAETDAKIVELAPAPGNYATVSNKAMTAIQEHQSLWPAVEAATNYADAVGAKIAGDATNYTDRATNDIRIIRTKYDFPSSGMYWLVDRPLELPARSLANRPLYLGSEQEETASLNDATNAAVAVADAKISTNNEAFVSAVLAAPLVGASQSDLTELSEYGSYGTVGAALLALIAGLAALKRRMASAETAINGKASASDLPYAMVTPGEWELSGSGYDPTKTYDIYESQGEEFYSYDLVENGAIIESLIDYSTEQVLSIEFFEGQSSPVTATRASLPDHLLDRAVNAVPVSSATALTLPEANPGHMRDLYVRLSVSASGAGSTVTWTVAQGESWDAMGAPPSSFAEGTYLYHISEVAAGVWHCDDMLALVGVEAALAGKIPMYPMIAVTPSAGTLTVAPYTVATYTADSTAAAFTVAVGTGTTGMARDCELVIDCTATGAVAPTVTWPATFHPRTDAGTDFACEAGVRNVYYISEYADGEFAVGGWQETTGGNA